jgi:hypothetical protein
MSRVRRAWARVEPHVATRRAGALLAVAALVVYALQALAWPVQRGRDTWDYFTAYLSLLDGDTPFPLVMLVRPPVTPLVLGPAAQLGGADALEVLGALLFAVMVVAWAATALTFSRLAAVLVAGALLVYAPLALPYHEPSSDMVVGAGFALFALGLARTCLRPTVRRFALLGLGLAALVLARPSYQVLVVAVAAVLLVPAGWGRRGRFAAAFLAAAAVPLALWAVHNGVRYGDTAYSRSGTINVPFYPAFLRGELDPGNGPASARLARLIEREILVQPAYRRYDVDARTFMRSGTNYETVHLLGLHDRLFGLGSDYELLHDAAREVPGGTRIRGVDLGAAWRSARSWLGRLPPFEHRTKPERWPVPAPTIDVDGRPMPNPAALPPSAVAIPFGFLQCASDEIARCIVRDPAAALGDPRQARRYAEVTRTVARWDEGLGAREPDAWLAARLDTLRRVLPGGWAWLALAVVALAVRRPRHALVVAAPAVLALLVLGVHALGGRPDPFYALPVLPALVVVGITALCAPRGEVREGLA